MHILFIRININPQIIDQLYVIYEFFVFHIGNRVVMRPFGMVLESSYLFRAVSFDFLHFFSQISRYFAPSKPWVASSQTELQVKLSTF